MFVQPTNTKRFNLYHMDESEIYIQDFYGYCSYFDLSANQQRKKEKGKFYICSKSLVFQSDNKNVPLVKFKLQHFKALPTFTNQNFKFITSRITAIKSIPNTPPEPFRLFQDLNQKIQITPSYQNVRNIQQWLTFLFENAKKKANYDLEDKIYIMLIEKYNKKQFNKALIESVTQKPMLEQTNILAHRILPLNTIYGYFFITDQKVYFEPFHNLAGNTVDKIQIPKIQKLFKRRYELREIGLEIITDKSYYFTFYNEQFRNKVYSVLAKRVSGQCVKIDQLQNITMLWQNRQITNFDYLMHLNQAGNRSFSDLSQYPIFPWVIQDYDSQEINLQNQKTYRDLSKPIGAINQERLQHFLMRYEGMQSPKFMYGSHYSTPGYVIGYLVRTRPQYMLKLQSGRFDKADRLFKSIKDDWMNVMENPTSVKQLIPEFFMKDVAFLKNYQNLDLGVTQNKKRVKDVQLPPWAKGDPRLFLKTMKDALQSQYVSKNLHKWIDLIFGYKQRGQQAIKANNVFHPLAYEGMVNIEEITDPIERMGLKCQINEFGQCPKQIFKIPHPSRDSLKPLIKQEMFNDIFGDEKPKENKNFDKFDEIFGDSNPSKEDYQSSSPIKVTSIKNMAASKLYNQNGMPKVKTVLSMGKEKDIKYDTIPKAHKRYPFIIKSAITHAIHMASKPNSLLTIGSDGFLKIFDVQQKTCLKSFKICEFHLSCITTIKDDQIFAIGSWDNNIYLFNTVYGSKSKPYPIHDNSINDIVFLKKKKKLMSASWDCTIKTMRYVGNVLDNQQHYYDHENQIVSLAVSRDQKIVAFGDIQGNVVCLSLQEKQQLYQLNMNSQKITRLLFIESNLCCSAETEMRLLDIGGNLLASMFVDKMNGTINDMSLQGEHVFIVTSMKHLVLFDILQQKRVGGYFNDFTYAQKDKLPDEKGLTCVVSGNDGLFVAVGGENGNLYVLRN